MWLQAQMWWRLRNDGNVASNNVASGTNVVAVRNVASNNAASKCGVRHPCAGSPKCGVKQCGVKMWRQTLPLPNCLPGNVSSKKVFSGRHKSATLNACALYIHVFKQHRNFYSKMSSIQPTCKVSLKMIMIQMSFHKGLIFTEFVKVSCVALGFSYVDYCNGRLGNTGKLWAVFLEVWQHPWLARTKVRAREAPQPCRVFGRFGNFRKPGHNSSWMVSSMRFEDLHWFTMMISFPAFWTMSLAKKHPLAIRFGGPMKVRHFW